jgi:hypothetical protein
MRLAVTFGTSPIKTRLLMSVAGVPSLLATLVATALEVSGPLIPQPQMCSDLVDSLGRYK